MTNKPELYYTLKDADGVLRPMAYLVNEINYKYGRDYPLEAGEEIVAVNIIEV